MNTFVLIFAAAYILIIFLIVTNTKLGIALFISYSLLVPVVKIPLNIPLGENFCYILAVCVYFLKNYKRISKIDYKPFKPFVWLFGAMTCLIPFQGVDMFLPNINYMFFIILSCLLYPMVIYSVICLEHVSLKMFLFSIVISGLIFTLYGIYLISIPGINPYLMVVLPIFGEVYNLAYGMGYSGLTEGVTENYDLYGGRIFGRIFSVFRHPMVYVLNLGFFMSLCAYLFRNKIKYIVPCVLIIGIAILTSGVRTGIAAMAVTISMILLYQRRIKLLVSVFLALMMFAFIIPLISADLGDFILSIVSSEKGDVSGSSLNMRLRQFVGCWDIISSNFIFGKGLNWVYIYLTAHTVHPVLLTFESLVFVIICNMGIMGLVIWTVFLYKQYHFFKDVKDKAMASLLIGLFTYYLVYVTITGDYGFMKYLMLYYSIALGMMTQKGSTKTNAVKFIS